MQICRIYLSEQFRILMSLPYFEYFGKKIEFLIFKSDFFKSKHKNNISSKNVRIQICRTFSIKPFCMITFFRISYSLTEKWICIIDYYIVIT